MKHFIKYLLLSTIILAGCEPVNKFGAHEYITFVNNSDENVLVSYGPYVPPDTLCHEFWLTYINSYIHLVKAQTANISPLALLRLHTTWENYLSILSSGTVIIFVHDEEKSKSICGDENLYGRMEMQGLDSTLNEQIIVKRYYCSIKDLDSLNWTITYP